AQFANAVQRHRRLCHLSSRGVSKDNGTLRKDDLACCNLNILKTHNTPKFRDGMLPVSPNWQPDLPPEGLILARGKGFGIICPQVSQLSPANRADCIDQLFMVPDSAGAIAPFSQVVFNQALKMPDLPFRHKNVRVGDIALVTNIQ